MNGTNPRSADTDGDGLLDSEEVDSVFFPTGDVTNTNPLVMDTDKDKFAALEAAGVKTVKSLADIGKGLREVTGW